MNDSDRVDISPAGRSASRGALPRVFEASLMLRELNRDAWLRGGLIGLLILIVLFGSALPGGEMVAVLLIVMVLVVWIRLNLTNSRSAYELETARAMVAARSAEVDRILSRVLRRWGLQRSVRMMGYVLLVQLRMAEGKLVEAGSIARTLLTMKLPGEPRPRIDLLLGLTETSLALDDHWTAWQSLAALETLPLRLDDRLHQAMLQMRYESGIGRWDACLFDLERKMTLCGLMRWREASKFCELAAEAADNLNQPALSQWLHGRSRLLAGHAESEVA
ncbi:MAG: hypothetical protein JJU36_16385 [Phycisphaeraceae bacterium]|nr:hypothetical protein [Phycisphaeraceae bacterium]